MINVDVVVNYPNWKKRVTDSKFFINKIVKFLPKKFKFEKKKIFLTLLLSNNKNIKKLNYKFRKKNKPTDILSFPLNTNLKKEIYLGDIIISYQFVNKPKGSSNLEFKKKLTKLFIHGFLHLLGYDHKKNKDYKKMYEEELKIFNLIEKKIEKIN
tara:strand:- start:1337 stop:1801 length:465 start_codon:yes stop_codon:yes gene_type:complete